MPEQIADNPTGEEKLSREEKRRIREEAHRKQIEIARLRRVSEYVDPDLIMEVHELSKGALHFTRLSMQEIEHFSNRVANVINIMHSIDPERHWKSSDGIPFSLDMPTENTLRRLAKLSQNEDRKFSTDYLDSVLEAVIINNKVFDSVPNADYMFGAAEVMVAQKAS